MASLLTLFSCLSETLNLIEALKKYHGDAETNEKVKNQIVQIALAFDTKDPNVINAIFNK